MRDFVYKSYYYFKTPSGRKPKNEEAVFSNLCSWSRIGDANYPQHRIEDYYKYQNAVKELIEKAKTKGLTINNKIEFDYCFWEDAKLLRDKGVTIEDIWNNKQTQMLRN